MFICVNDWYLLPRDNGGSIFLLFDGLLVYLFTLMISHIFYKIPDNHGLLVKNVIRQNGITDRLSVKLTFYRDRRSSHVNEGAIKD